LSRHAAAKGKPDANHGEIVAAYEELYCSVVDTHGQGFGFPDLVVGISGHTCLVECKTDEGELLLSQRRFQRDWRGSKVEVVRTREDVLKHVQRVRQRVSKGITHEARVEV
jgi:hypothetical protein